MRTLVLAAGLLLGVFGAASAQEQVYGNSTVTYDDRLNGTDGTNPNVNISASVADIVKAGLDQQVLTGTATFNGADNADGAGETTTITVTGAALGDFCIGISFGVDLAGNTVTCYVSAANTVAVRLQNESGGSSNLASTTISAAVLPKSVLGL
jgi:hypothetical protein